MAPVRSNPVVRLEDWTDHRPRGLDRILTGEERSVHGVAQKPLGTLNVSGGIFGGALPPRPDRHSFRSG
jgi:hypothetical protein